MRYIILLLLVLDGCMPNSLSIRELSKYEWIYEDGYHIGDVLHFDKSNHFSISEDSIIYKNDVIVGRLLDFNKGSLMILSEKNEKGYYRNLRVNIYNKTK
jgi:hypothetical protein